MAPITSKCRVPVIENGYVWSAKRNRTYDPGHILENGEEVHMRCRSGNQIGSDSIYCFDGALSDKPPRCISNELPAFVVVTVIFNIPLPPSRGMLDTRFGHALRGSRPHG